MVNNTLLNFKNLVFSDVKNMQSCVQLAINFKADWVKLMEEYCVFYKFSPAQNQLETVFNDIKCGIVNSLVAVFNSEVVAVANFLYHPHTFSGKVCYINDLFVTQRVRRCGIATQLFAEINKKAFADGCTKIYWNTAPDNPACSLYDRIANKTIWVRYEMRDIN